MMDSIKDIVQKWASTWQIIGTFLAGLAGVGLAFPGWVSVLFSGEFVSSVTEAVEIILVAVGAIIAIYNKIREQFAASAPDSEVSSLSAKQVRKFKGAFGPIYTG